MANTSKKHIATLIQTGRLAEAERLCTRACKATPADAEIWFMLAGICAQQGEAGRVVDLLGKALSLQPDYWPAHLNLGMALKTLNRPAEAIHSFERVLKHDVNNTTARIECGLCLWQLSRLDEAAIQLGEAIRIEPGSQYAHNLLGLVRKNQDRLDEAASEFRAASNIDPAEATFHYNLGLCYSLQGKDAAAEEAYIEAIRLRPDYAEAYSDLGSAYFIRGKFEDARKSYQRTIELRPEFAGAHSNLAYVLVDMALFEEAEQHYRKALSLEPGSLHILCGLGMLFTTIGRYDDALSIYGDALRENPDYPEAIVGKARVLERQGDYEGASGLIQPLIDRGVEHFGAAICYAELAPRTGRRQAAIRFLERLADKELMTHQRIDIHFALGKLYDQSSLYDQAFAHYLRANSLRPTAFAASHWEAMFEQLLSTYSAAQVAHRPRASNRSELPVFIVGMPRSGTSLVESILASHPAVYGGGEFNEINEIVNSLPGLLHSEEPYPRCISQATQADLDTIAARYLNNLKDLSDGASRVTDKMPQNFLALGLIDMLFPEARVIHCMRDPLDTCLSIFFLHFNANHPYAGRLEDLGSYYNRYQELMEHWRSVLRMPMLEVRYEDVVEHQEATSRRLVEFCGLDWDPACLRFYESDRILNTFSYNQVRQPIYKGSVGRWKDYRRHLQPLIQGLKEQP